jgi:hypothetical protein
VTGLVRPEVVPPFMCCSPEPAISFFSSALGRISDYSFHYCSSIGISLGSIRLLSWIFVVMFITVLICLHAFKLIIKCHGHHVFLHLFSGCLPKASFARTFGFWPPHPSHALLVVKPSNKFFWLCSCSCAQLGGLQSPVRQYHSLSMTLLTLFVAAIYVQS